MRWVFGGSYFTNVGLVLIVVAVGSGLATDWSVLNTVMVVIGAAVAVLSIGLGILRSRQAR
jgi:hypothetical protein